MVGDSLLVLRPWYSWNIAESDAKTQNINQSNRYAASDYSFDIFKLFFFEHLVHIQDEKKMQIRNLTDEVTNNLTRPVESRELNVLCIDK